MTEIREDDQMTEFTCTAVDPWGPGIKARPIIHPDAYETGCRDGYPGGDIVTMLCPHCGHEWEMELAQ